VIELTVANRLAVARLNQPPAHLLDPPLLDRLCSVLDQALADAGIELVLLRGDDRLFSGGADVELFHGIRSAADAVALSTRFQAAFRRIEDSPKPVVAALAGHVVGGALELAMACHARIAAPQTRFSMPEVHLGINPGAGGTVRLPRLIGVQPALEMLLTGSPIDAQTALSRGLIDMIAEPHQWPAAAEALFNAFDASAAGAAGSSDRLAPWRTTRRDDRLGSAEERQAAWRWADEVIARCRPELIAPREILDTVRRGVEESSDAGFRAEGLAFARCMATAAAQDKIYLFMARKAADKSPQIAPIATAPVFSQSDAARRPENETATRPQSEAVACPESKTAALPPPIRRAAVVGLGTMGAGIAQALAEAGIDVLGVDPCAAAVASARTRIEQSWQRRRSQGKLDPRTHEELAARLRLTVAAEPDSPCDLLIEAVVEDPALKREVLARGEAAVTPEGIVATNTSTINLDDLAPALKRPARFLGMHFFHPAQSMPLVEVIPRAGTTAEVAAAVVALVKRLKKTPIIAANREGFVVNRLFIPYLKEAFWLLHEGAAAEQIDRAMTDFGFAMGPLQLIDMSGLDILVKTDAVMQRAFPYHGPLPPAAARLVEHGLLGQKTSAGVYRYEPGDRTPRPNPAAEEIIAAVRLEQPRDAAVAASEIADRLVLRLAVEAFRALDEQLVGRPGDLDVAMVLGTGLADFRGGPLRYARRRGLGDVLARLSSFERLHGARFAPPTSLRIAVEGTAAARAAMNPLWRQYLQEGPN